MSDFEGYTKEAAAKLEECHGCGWSFDEGGERHVHPIPGDVELTGTVHPRECRYHALCDLCERSISWHASNYEIRGLYRDIANISNLILAEILCTRRRLS